MTATCTGCERCACFAGEAQTICLHPLNRASAVRGYYPIGRTSARLCPYYRPGQPRQFEPDELAEAIDFSVRTTGEQTCDGLREWVKAQDRKARS